MNNKLAVIKKVNKLIFVDNLELSFTGNIPLISNSTTPDINGNKRCYHYNKHWYIEYQYGGTKMYKHVADLYFDDNKIGEFKFLLRRAFEHTAPVNFKFENNVLYQQNYHELIDTIIEVLNLDFLYISHIDIAVDCIDHKLMKYVNNYLFRTENGKEYKTRHKGKVKRENIFTNVDSKMHWGNINSDKYIKIYNKTAEIENNNNIKKYITECWRENGMITENKSVERFELTLSQKHAKLYDYHKLSDSDYLASIMQTQCKNFFDFEQTYRNHGKKRKRNVTPINFKGFNTVLLAKFRYESKNTLHNEKVILKQLYFQYLLAEYIASDDYVKTGAIFVPEKIKNYPDIYFTIESLLYKFPALRKYFNIKKYGWKKEFYRTNKVTSGKQSIEDYLQSLELENHHNIVSEYEDTLGLLSFKINDMQLADLESRCKSLELKNSAEER
jgi:hypothetical protein